MSTTSRTRLSVAARRNELLTVGCLMFATRPYDEVWIDRVAKAAGVSDALIYHYFGSKKAFVVAIVKREAEALLDVLVTDPSAPPEEQFRASLDAYLDYLQNHPHGYLTIYQGLGNADPEVREILAGNRRVLQQRMLTWLTDSTPTEAQRLTIHGWIAFQVDVCVTWLKDPTISRDELRDLLTGVYNSVLAVIKNQ